MGTRRTLKMMETFPPMSYQQHDYGGGSRLEAPRNGLRGMILMRQFVGGVSMAPILCLCREDYQEGMKDFIVPLIHIVSVSRYRYSEAWPRWEDHEGHFKA
jgi:hypothetical protein